MPKITAILGHVTIETAKRSRICERHRKTDPKHIKSGELCLVVHDANGSGRNYCLSSAADILQKAEEDLVRLRQEIQQP